jgi:outer membrane murein-binding lipoprotein Lpp
MQRWKDLAVFKERFLQYVSNELINSFEDAAAAGGVPDAIPSPAAAGAAGASASSPVAIGRNAALARGGSVPATPPAIAGAAGASLGDDAELVTPRHPTIGSDLSQILQAVGGLSQVVGGLAVNGQQTNHQISALTTQASTLTTGVSTLTTQVSTLTTQVTKFQARTEGRLNDHADRIQKIEHILDPTNLMEMFENLEKQDKLDNAENQENQENRKKSNRRVSFGTRNEYFEIPPRGSEKKLKPALKESTPTQPSTRSTRSRSAQGSTPVRMTTRSSSRKNEK